MHAMLAGRPEQRLRESTVTAIADDQQVGPGRLVEQHLGGVPLYDLVRMLGRRGVAGDIGDGLAGGLLACCSQSTSITGTG
jgi:hypothetical protein